MIAKCAPSGAEGKVSGFLPEVGAARASREKKLLVLCKSYNIWKEGPQIIILPFGEKFVGVSVRK